MIQLVRQSQLPRKLETHSEGGVTKLMTAYNSGDKIEPDNDIYGHTSVKDTLEFQQHGKCAFCETKLIQQFGNVEHFRPKKEW